MRRPSGMRAETRRRQFGYRVGFGVSCHRSFRRATTCTTLATAPTGTTSTEQLIHSEIASASARALNARVHVVGEPAPDAEARQLEQRQADEHREEHDGERQGERPDAEAARSVPSTLRRAHGRRDREHERDTGAGEREPNARSSCQNARSAIHLPTIPSYPSRLHRRPGVVKDATVTCSNAPPTPPTLPASPRRRPTPAGGRARQSDRPARPRSRRGSRGRPSCR